MRRRSLLGWSLGNMAVLLAGLLLGGCGSVPEQPVSPDEAARQQAITQQGIMNPPPSEADRQNAITRGATAPGQ